MDIARPPRFEPVIQFTVFSANRVGRLNELVQVLSSNDVHIMALSTQDITETTVLRVIVNYPEVARKLLEEQGFSFCEHKMFAVELPTEQDMRYVVAALTEAEININYVYAFLMRPNGHCGLAISLEDNDLAWEVLTTRGVKVICQRDIAR